ncbi:DUF2145 domain-containing protein [Rugamonas sp. CCM 8940]|uniref:DUF2145 domain-containing protein n=1 Tax=Rugamonas sp. CCM 8940 TaxID=2765359 RepID=UPI0018F390FB|nr:DUF2145 domain-containing protein [Rugamonas sp. CCM 8940]MBJ7311070.1 DUF2145 domain-containing protein [Rugamonas sp. CCM 8940]
MRPLAWACTALALSAALCVPSAQAGQSCEERPLSSASLSDALATGHAVQTALNASGSDIAIVGRQGQDLSKYGLKYTHVGVAYRGDARQPWRVYELLNDCGTASSDLWIDGLANFFLADPFTLDAILIVPPEKLRAKLAEHLRAPGVLRGLHEAKYNMVAYPFSTKYQNSNQWVLELLAAAEASDVRIRSREQAQAWLKMAGYQPTEMHIGPLTRLGGRIVKANVAFDDHPSALRFSDRINAVTVDSIVAFVRQRDEGWTFTEIKGRKPSAP